METPDHQCLKNLRILIVEDEVLISEVIYDILSDAGAAIIGVARNVAEALEIIDRLSPNAATLDGALDGIFSDPVAERLEEMNIRYLVVSGAPTFGDMRLSAAPRLMKPFTAEALIAAVLLHLC